MVRMIFNHIHLWIFLCLHYEVVLWNFENRWRHGGHGGGNVFLGQLNSVFMQNFRSFHQSFTDAYQVIENNPNWSLMGSFRCRFILQVSQLRLNMACARMAQVRTKPPLQTFFWLRHRSCGKGKLYVINKSNSWEGKSIHSHVNGSLPRRVPDIILKHLPLILSTRSFEAFVILQQVSPWELNKMTATRQCKLFDWSIW